MKTSFVKKVEEAQAVVQEQINVNAQPDPVIDVAEPETQAEMPEDGMEQEHTEDTQSLAIGMFKGEAFQGEVLPQNVSAPRIKVVQKNDPISEHFQSGGIVLNNEYLLSDSKTPLEVTIVRARKEYVQILPFGAKDDKNQPIMPLRFNTLKEVHERGGTIDWVNNIAPSYDQTLHLMVIVEKNASSEEAPFGHEFNGRKFLIGMWSLSKSAFKANGDDLITQLNTTFTKRKPDGTVEQRFLYTHYGVLASYVKKGINFIYVPKFKMMPQRTDEEVKFFASILPNSI